MRDFVRLWVNGREVAARGACALMTLSDFLRRELRLTGTKIVCAEGDCGSCSVLVGRVVGADDGSGVRRAARAFGPRGGETQCGGAAPPHSPPPAAADGAAATSLASIEYKVVCGCIATVGQLDGAHVVTVEGLGDRAGGGGAGGGGGLNCVQKAFCEGHGAQCGFCTPGFVVALQGAAERGVEWSREPLRRELVGNLCRCTGYESILDSACAADVSKLTRLESLYPSSELARAMLAAAAEEVRVEAGSGGDASAGLVGGVARDASDGVAARGGSVATVVPGARVIYKPVTLAQAVAFRAEHPASVVLSGGTDLGVAVNKRKLALGVVMTLGGIAELRGIRVAEGVAEVGACATVAELEGWAGVEDDRRLKPPQREDVSELTGGSGGQQAAVGDGGRGGCPELAEYLKWFASPPVKAAASVAGNVVTGSPIGDLLPPLLALGATVNLASIAGTREVPLDGFYTGYRKSVMRADELVAGLLVPLPGAGERVWFYKVSRRKDLDISAVSVAIRLGREPRVAFGGVAATPVRLKGAEAVLARDGGSAESLKAAAEVAMNEVTPLSDHRGSAAYRKLLVRNVLIKAAGELFGAAEGGPA